MALADAGREWSRDMDRLMSYYDKVLLLLFPLMVFLGLARAAGLDEGACTVINGVAPIFFIGVLIGPLYGVVRRCPDATWAPAFWLPVSLAIFYGFGPLIEVYGNNATKLVLSTQAMAASQEGVLRANLLSTVGTFFVLLGLWAHAHARTNLWRAAFHTKYVSGRYIDPMKLALIFVSVGGLLKYGLIKPAEWGELNVTVPGVVSNLGFLIDIGFAILAFLFSGGRRTARIVFLSVWPIHIALTFLSLSKMELVIAMFLPVLGAYLRHHRLRRLVLSMGAIALTFALVQPMVIYGRNVIEYRTGNISDAGYAERAQILAGYWQGAHDVRRRETPQQDWWLRLDFSRQQAYAMSAYDQGNPGSTLSAAWMLFIPRVIWPEKPVMLGPGLAFYHLVSGNQGVSFLGLSVFGDLYWEFGWMGVMLGCPLIGWLFGAFSWRSIAIIRSRDFLLMPAVLIALEAALLGMNRYLINGIIAVIPTYFAYIWCVALIRRLGNRVDSRSI